MYHLFCELHVQPAYDRVHLSQLARHQGAGRSSEVTDVVEAQVVEDETVPVGA